MHASTREPFTLNSVHEGPLGKLGPATRWCLLAGLATGQESPPSSEAIGNELDQILVEGLAPIAVRGLADHPTHRVTPEFRILQGAALLAQMQSMNVEASGLMFQSQLEDVGIRTAVIKGPAIGRFHPDGWPRPFADIDFVVSKRQFPQAISQALSHGFVYSERSVPQWRWFDDICREGINLHSPAGGNIDIHHHVPPWAVGSHLSTTHIIQRSQRIDTAGRQARFAAPEDLLIISTLHILNDLWKGKLGVASWRDVIVLMKLLGPSRSQEAFSAVRLAWLYDLIEGQLALHLPEVGISPSSPAAELPASARLRLGSAGWSGNSTAARHRLAWAARLPTLNAIAFLAGTAVPSPSYIRARHHTYRNYWKRSFVETVSTAKGSDFRMTTIDDV